MITQLKDTKHALRERVRYNLNKIHENEEEIQEILKETVSDSRSRSLSEKYAINRKLIRENQEALKIQWKLINYINNFKHEIEYVKDELN